MNNEEKFKVFLEVAGALNKSFDITPVLYGSLGLYRVIQASSVVNDVDVLVPHKFVNDEWEKLVDFMKGLGFRLKDEHEHEFEREREFVAFAAGLDLVEMIGIQPGELKISDIDGVRFKELSPEQYLKLYQFMLRDNYRQEKRGTADQEKIALINKYLSAKN